MQSPHNQWVRVVISEFPSGRPVLPEHVTFLAIGHDGKVRFGVIGDLTVEVQHEDWNHSVEVHLELSPSQQRYLNVGVNVAISREVMSLETLPHEHPVQEVTGVLLRTIRVAEIARLGALGGIFVMLDPNEPPASLLQWLGPQPKYDGVVGEIMRSQGPTRANLELVALHYYAAQMAGVPPAKTVESTFDLPSRTAAYWIAKAKSEGLLDPLEFKTFIPPPGWRGTFRKPYEFWWPDG